jgi:ribosomal protein S18 acetylase RimI-like enzyme
MLVRFGAKANRQYSNQPAASRCVRRADGGRLRGMIRPMTPADTFPCTLIDPAMETAWSFQLQRAAQGGVESFRLGTLRPPRPRRVEGYPLDPPLDDRLARASAAVVCEVEDDLLGYAIACPAAAGMTIESLVVEEARRRQGIGGRLLRALLEAAPAARVRCETPAENGAAADFLRAQGFRLVGVLDADAEAGVRAVFEMRPAHTHDRDHAFARMRQTR